MKNKTNTKFFWTLVAVGAIGGGIIIFNFENTDSLVPEGMDLPLSVANKTVESQEIQEILKDPEIIAKIEEFKESLDLLKHLRTESGEIRPAPPSSVKVINNASYQPPNVRYVSEETAAELGLSSHQVDEFQKVVNYYRQQMDQHIIDNSTIEVLGDKHHKISIPIMENGSEIRDAVSQELHLLFGNDKFDEFQKINRGRLDKFFHNFGEYPRTVEIQATEERGPFGDELIKFRDTTHLKSGNSVWGDGRFSSNNNFHRKVYTDLIASYND